MTATGRKRRVPSRDDSDVASKVQATLSKLRAIMSKGGVLGDVFGVSREGRDALYAKAYDVYAQGQYKQAQQLFAQLSLYDHQDSRYMKGLAATTQMLEDYEQALQMYAVVAMMDVTDPVPVMHGGDCLNAMGRHAEAAESFVLALSMCSGGVEHEQVRQRCEQLLAALKRRAA
jgi:type III secretion system low calcium response chaperone LcrH/SycD